MNTDRIDTDAPLNSNHNEEEEPNQYRLDDDADQRIPTYQDHFQEQNQGNQIKSNQSSSLFGGKTSIEKFSYKSTKQIKIGQKQGSFIDINDSNYRKPSNETISNKSQKQVKRNDESMFNMFVSHQAKDGADTKSNERQSEQNQQRKSKKVIEEEDIQEIEEDQLEDQTTGSPPQQRKRNSKLHNIQNIGRVENDLLLFESQNMTDNSDRKNSQGREKHQNNQKEQGNEQDFLELDEIEIKRIEIPKTSIKKTNVQTIGIVRYMENSFLGKKKPSVEEQSSKNNAKNGNNSEQKDKNMLYLSFNQGQQNDEQNSSKEHVKTINSKNVNPTNENLFQKYPTSVSQYRQQQMQSSLYKFDSFEDTKKQSKLMNNSSKQDDKKSLSTKSKNNQQDGQKNKFITYKKIKLVRRMIKIFEKFNIIRRFVSIPSNYFRFFGDKASWFHSESEEQSIFQKLKRKIDQQKKQYNSYNFEQEEQVSKLVLYEDNKLVVLLKLFVIFFSVLQCIYIPTQIAFSNSFEPTQNLNIIFTIIPTIVFIIDIYVNFNLAFFFNGKLVVNRRQIAANYFFGNYWFDFISIILQITMDKSVPSLIYRIVVIKKELERILAIYQIQEKFYYAYRLIRLAIELLLSCHILACTFILAASYSPSHNNWIEENKLYHQSNDIIYLNSLYYIVVTIATIGYGDIHPVSNTEKLFLIFIAFVTSGLFAYNISTISSIVNDSIRKKLEVKRQILSITEYMTERNISRSIQNQILQQLYYNMRTEKRSPQVINECLKHVSQNLKGSLFSEYFGNILSTNKYFKRKFSKQFLKSLVPKFKEEVFAPGQILFQNGETDQKLVFVRKGEIVLYLDYTNPTPIVQEYQEGKWFGFEEFFTGEPKNCQAKSLEFTSIVFIERKDFLEVIQSFPKDKEKFCMIKDKIRFSSMPINYNCNICHSIFHQIQTCPYVQQNIWFEVINIKLIIDFMNKINSFAKKKEYIIQKNNYQLTSKREPFLNRRIPKYNSRMTNEQVRYQLKNFRMTYLLMAEGFNLYEYQGELNECNSILENQKLHKREYQNYSDERLIYQDNPSKEFNQNMISSHIAVHNSNQAIGSYTPQDGSLVSYNESPLPKPILPESLQKNLSKFGENASRVKQDDESPDQMNEIPSPLSVRKTRQSFKNEDGSIEYRSADPKDLHFHENNQQKLDAIQKQNSKSIHFSTQNHLKEDELNETQKDEEEFSIPRKISKNIFVNHNSFDMKDSYAGQQRQKLFGGGRFNKKAVTFVLKPQNMNNIIKILPNTIETDQEFFQKYDGIKWENNELQVIKQETVTSQTSMNQIDAINEIFPKVPTISNMNFMSAQKNIINSTYSQAQAQIVSHNLSVINEETQKEDKEDCASILPITSVQPPTNEQQILTKILNEVEQIKQQQDMIRMEATSRVQKMEAHITSALHRTFTFSTRSYQHTVDEHVPNEQSARFFQNADDVSFGKKKTTEVDDTNKNSEEGQKDHKFDSNKRIQNEICPIQNDSQPFSFQQEKNLSQNPSQVHMIEEIKNPSQVQQIPVQSPPLVPQSIQNSSQNNQPLFMPRRQSKLNQQSLQQNSLQNQEFQQVLSQSPQYFINKSVYLNPAMKLKEKIEIQFFLAFERQNNWKTYFPTQNLSYITEKIIKSQKRRLKIETIPPLKMVESTLQQTKKGSKFRRLSQLIQENRERNGTFSQNNTLGQRKQSINNQKNTAQNKVITIKM